MVPELYADVMRTRVIAPRLPNRYVIRVRLLNMLDLTADQRVTIVRAPAGYGKTTLAVSWLEKHRVQAAWVSLDTDSNDVMLFWRYVMNSLASVLPHDTHLVLSSAIHSLPAQDASLCPDLIANELAYCPSRFTLVIDDYHVIEDCRVHEGMARLVDQLPNNVHILLLTRVEPPLPVTRWAAKGWLDVIDQTDLAFTEEETRDFFRQVYGMDLSSAESRRVGTLTEGWAAGLKLLGLSTKPVEFVEQQFRSGKAYQEIISNYLMTEVMQTLPVDVQEFLLRMSVAAIFNAKLAFVLTDIQDAESMIHRLMSMGLFITPFDRDQEWYRFHPLFSDYLQHRLRCRDVELWKALHQRAAQFLFAENRKSEAMEHLYITQDFGQLAAWIDQAAVDLINTGQIYTLLSWVERIPEPEKSLQPITWAFIAFAMTLAGDRRRAETVLDELASRFKDSEPLSEQGRVYAAACRVKAFIAASQGRLDECFEYIERFFRYAATEDTVRWRTVRHHRGELFLVRTDLARKGRADVSPDQAAQFIDRLLAYGTSVFNKQPPPSYLLVHLYLTICEAFYEYNHLHKAEEYLLKAMEYEELHVDLSVAIPTYANMARLFLAKGMYEASFHKIEQAIQLAAECAEPHWIQPLTAYQTLILLRNGRLSDAIQWSRRLRVVRGESVRRERYYEYMAVARLCVETGDYAEAMRIAAELRTLAKMEEQYYSYVEVTILKAMVEAASGRMDDAFESLQEALMMAEPYGYCRIFLDERKVHSLIRAYAFRTKRRKAPVRNRVSVNYLNRLLSLLPESLGMEQADGAESPPRVLSARELEIARLVARGFTNKEIAETLFISYRTVTTHLDKIYNKLHVHSRTELLVKLNDSRWI